MEKVEEKNNKFILYLMIVNLILVCAFTAFAYFKFVYESDDIIITTTNLKLNVTTYNLRDNTDISPTTWSEDLEENEKNTNIAKVNINVSSNSKINAEYKMNLLSSINQNESYEGGDVSDIKYKLYKDDKLVSEGEFDESLNTEILTGKIDTNGNLNETYQLYVYIEENWEIQDSLKDISFDFNFVTTANQIKE